MTSRSIGEILGGLQPAKRARSFQPVRRNSYYRGEREGRIWQRLGSNSQEARKLIAVRLQAAEHYNEQHKQPGERQGPLGDIGIRLLRELYRIVDFKTGRLEPAIDTLCQRIRRSRATLVKYLGKLREHGFLDWVRRSEPTGNQGAGPQVRQITNAYGFGLPAAAADWVNRRIGNGPPPDCEVARRDSDSREVETMLRTASLVENARFHASGTGSDDVLARMAAKIAEISASSLSGQNPIPVSL